MTKSPTSLILFIAILFSMSLGLAYFTGYASIGAQAITRSPTPTRRPTPSRRPTPTRRPTPARRPSPTISLKTQTQLNSLKVGSTTFSSPTPTKIGSSLPTPTPTRIGSSLPSPTPTKTSSGLTNTITGDDGTYCKDYGTGYTSTRGYCIDQKGTHYDYCSADTARQFYCSGTWNGKSWNEVYCADGGYICSSWGLKCSSGGCVDPKMTL